MVSREGLTVTIAMAVLRRNPFRRPWLSVALVALLGGAILADQRGWLLVRQIDDLSAYQGRSAAVSRIIDGDTIEVRLADALTAKGATRVRLMGVNCPEPARGWGGAEDVGEPLAGEAAQLTRTLISDRLVTLWLESHQPRDSFGAVLAHVELPGGLKLNEALLEAGLAKVDERWPHSMLVRYAQIEQAARQRKIGIWSPKER